MPEFMTVWWHGMLMGMVLVFVVWCVYEAVVQYRFERKMRAMDKIMSLRNYSWMWPRKGHIPPLFHEQHDGHDHMDK